MLLSETLHRLLVTGACLCVYGTPAYLHQQNIYSLQDRACAGLCDSSRAPAPMSNVASQHVTGLSGTNEASQHVTGLSGNEDSEGGAGLDASRAGSGEMVREPHAAKNGDIHVSGRSGPRLVGEAVRKERREVGAPAIFKTSSEQGEEQSWSKPSASLSSTSERDSVSAGGLQDNVTVASGAVLTYTEERQEMSEVVSTPQSALLEHLASSSTSTVVPLQPDAHSPRSAALENVGAAQRSTPRVPPSHEDSPSEKEAEIGRLSPTEAPGTSAMGHRLAYRTSSILTSVSSAPSLAPSPFPPPSEWGQDGMSVPTLPELLLSDVGPKQDGPESLWTEAVRESGVDTEVPLTQDQATEGTMSSQALPLIFDPFDDVTPQRAAAGVTVAPGGPRPLASMATGGMLLSEAAFDRLVTVETDSDGPSHPSPMLMPEWTSPWQTSGAEMLEPISHSHPSNSHTLPETQQGWTEHYPNKGTDKTENLKETSPIPGPSASSAQNSVTSVTEATRRYVSKPPSGLEEMESQEEPDEDEEDENTEESDEDESEEEETDTPPSTRAPYGLIPPPPVWVQRNQGLMRSWVELIREKAGYVSGMLAPVGIGIAGAILIVGALYSIRMLHRRRRNSFKYQRRKVRQQEQPREPGPSRQDQAMLLADSSEDEF